MSGRESISAEETLRLWVLAGGRCEYHGCNCYLLEDELTTDPLNLAERAHIVGATNAPGSPRGDDPLPLEHRGREPNLMLLCRDHHRLADKLIEEHGIDGMRAMKRAHEERIRLLTGLQDDVATVVVRAVGGIRGAPVDIPPAAVLAAVRADDRFPRYSLALAGEDLEVDLRDLPDEGDPEYWATGERMISAAIDKLREAQQPMLHLSVFALTRIPFLVALGYHFDDKVPSTIYPRRRRGTGDAGWGFDSTADPVEFEAQPLARPRAEAVAAKTVVIVVSVTASIGSEVLSLLPESGAGPIYEIGPLGVPCGRELLDARASLDAFADSYQGLLSLIEKDHPACTVIDLYVAAPAPAAVQLGRGLMRDAQPALRVFDRDANGKFSEALTLGRELRSNYVGVG